MPFALPRAPQAASRRLCSARAIASHVVGKEVYKAPRHDASDVALVVNRGVEQVPRHASVLQSSVLA